MSLALTLLWLILTRQWEPLTLKINFEDIYFSLNANTEKEMNIFLNPELHDFKPGKYKIIKRFYVSELGTEYLNTEFNMQ
ncbi:hypothetical protein AGMMS50239_19740 [Bacteroidia bacterium]|nr:hypothetical protein AGMMS50239_19740 [Bacteroidia bacterium]